MSEICKKKQSIIALLEITTIFVWLPTVYHHLDQPSVHYGLPVVNAKKTSIFTDEMSS